MDDAPSPETARELFQAIESRDVDALVTHFQTMEFILILNGSPDDEDAAAIAGEIEDEYSALILFTDEDRAGEFVAADEELIEDDQEITGMALAGAELLTFLPEGWGLMINLHADDYHAMPPDLTDAVRAGLAA